MPKRTRFVLPLLLLACALVLAGCATPKTIVMKNPMTGQIQQCVNTITYIGRGPAEHCAEALERDGWVRLGGE